MVNPRVALLFKKLSANYPRRLERNYGHILNRLMELWATPEFGPYIHDLLIDKRGGRNGFELEVLSELMFIKELHNIFENEGYRFPENIDTLAKKKLSWESIQVADPTPKGFRNALELGQLDLINIFLDAGVAVDHRFEDDQTPLIIAAICGQLEATHRLLARGAKVNLRDMGKYTALHWAAYYGHSQIAVTLIDAGATINAVQNSADTPLALAVTRGHLDAARLLLERKADPNIPDASGLPLAIAIDKKNLEMIALLEQFGAHR